jgi:hypothetical protein
MEVPIVIQSVFTGTTDRCAAQSDTYYLGP